MRTIDVQTLRKLGACSEARNWVQDTYGTREIELTVAALRAVPDQDWLAWLAKKLNWGDSDLAYARYSEAMEKVYEQHHARVAAANTRTLLALKDAKEVRNTRLQHSLAEFRDDELVITSQYWATREALKATQLDEVEAALRAFNANTEHVLATFRRECINIILEA